MNIATTTLGRLPLINWPIHQPIIPSWNNALPFSTLYSTVHKNANRILLALSLLASFVRKKTPSGKCAHTITARLTLIKAQLRSLWPGLPNSFFPPQQPYFAHHSQATHQSRLMALGITLNYVANRTRPPHAAFLRKLLVEKNIIYTREKISLALQPSFSLNYIHSITVPRTTQRTQSSTKPQ